MARYTVIKMSNLSPLHIGTGKEENYDFSSNELHSDTLSSALASIRAQQGKNTDIDNFLNDFRISSAFPYYNDILFMPKPHGNVNARVKDKQEHECRKKMKKIKFIDITLWQELINGKSIEIDECQLNNEFLSAKKINDKIYQSQVNQRVSVPRDGNSDTSPFFFEWKYFNSSAGLFCILDTTKEREVEIIELFNILSETGLGTDRNVGGGKFDVDISTIEICEPSDANSLMLLSLYIPTKEEMGIINLEHSCYNLLLRGGYIAGSSNNTIRHLRKKSIYMFDVGSTFPTTGTLNGKVVDLRPEWNSEDMHPIYRSGIPLSINIKTLNHE